MSYRIYNGTQLLGNVNNKSTGINGLLPATNYQFGVSNYDGNRESSKTTINVKTRGIRLIIPTSLTVNSIITLNYQEYSLGLVPIGTEPAGMFGGGNKRNIQAKVISVDNGKSTVELLEPLESSSTVSIGGTNLLKDSLIPLTASGVWMNDGVSNQIVDDYVKIRGISNNNRIYQPFSNNGLNADGYYSISFWASNDGNNEEFDVQVGTWSSLQTVHITTGAIKQYKLENVWLGGNPIFSFVAPFGKVVRLKKIKLEKETIATDWSPAPEDTQYIVDNTQMNELQDGSFAAFNGYRAIYFRQ
ncbi:hypothetical protein [Ligilactobacillus salivarius]|uniref:hypothetical protein n=1 Tax=Ligilactobacillus salivarius TaxID=1624 RepID=UPI001370985B|nr:hypothetical protein [Ligilactobacillus salivarius]MYZ84000.1 hypothetical protein [Ligilactobacillus salivarius]